MNYSIFINLNYLLSSNLDDVFFSKSDINEINNAKKLGIKIILYSKNKQSLDVLQKLSKINFDYLIYNNNQYLYDFKSKKNILENEKSEEKLIKFLLEESKIDLLKSMAVGKNKEDLFILKQVNFSYAIANSELEIKKITKYHTSDLEQNAISEAIIDYIYRNKIK